MNAEAKTTIDDLFELKGANREAKAYAFLWAAFRRTEISANPVRDALDCLIPFVAPYTNKIAGKQVTAEGIQNYLKEFFGFDIPQYAIDQLIKALTQQGFVAYRQHLRAHFALAHESGFDVAKSEIETEFDDLAAELAAYAAMVGFSSQTPPSGSWGEALIAFLRVRTDRSPATIVKIKGALIDPKSAEMAIVGAFIRRLHTDSPNHFEKIVHIFMGVLIEDFISSVTEIGTLRLDNPVTVMYDTAVLLRQLGCSGKNLSIATEELTRYLQDLGMKICYFAGNEAEVANILNTIVHVKDVGGELEGETAAAIADGEVTTTSLRMLQNSFPEQLARFGIFPADDLESGALNAVRFQIDEAAFSVHLDVKAKRSGRAYSAQNRANDAGYLASIMRLRKGNRTRDLAGCGYVFVTPNNFLVYESRRFLIQQRMLGHNNFPPMISLGQIATIAWLLKDQAIPPEKAGRELLTNCFAAIRPDAEWFKYFREGIEKVVSNSLEEYSSSGENSLTVQAARRIAQDESFGSSAVVRQLNMAEILSRAEVEQKRVRDEQDAKLVEERERAELEKASILERVEQNRVKDLEAALERERAAVRSAVKEAREEIEAQIAAERERIAHRRASSIVVAIKIVLLILFAATTIAALFMQNNEAGSSKWLWILTAILGILSILAFADFVKIRFVEPIFEKLHRWLAKQLVRSRF
ncbi:hypothetical protein SAMN02745157_0577 [Kaistia soli DSM 19436]|uniref:Uncharacterized protein n=1 Tax=Kaistia soli DSM 19436 TaxID=1122133 RepID=A0A1M4V095_9HYPH|nr:hypothetical protein [Kaistia soli]SHE62323.1 hypothetical protein SAMN02745157_0577 [Kaistia soli DSM 19436]